jgi:ClpP class serine protease
MASAAYYIGSAADEVVVTPGGEVGSIGVFMAHQDLSAALEQEGVKITLISAGKFKTEANPFESLSDEAKAALQKTVNVYYESFVNAVAKGRDAKASEVRNGYGQGRMVTAKEAVLLGMADRIETLDETIGRLARGGFRRKNRSGAAGLDYSATELSTFKAGLPTAEGEIQFTFTPSGEVYEEDEEASEEDNLLDGIEDDERRRVKQKMRRLRFELDI